MHLPAPLGPCDDNLQVPPVTILPTGPPPSLAHSIKGSFAIVEQALISGGQYDQLAIDGWLLAAADRSLQETPAGGTHWRWVEGDVVVGDRAQLQW